MNHHINQAQVVFDSITDELNDTIDRLMNYFGGGALLSGQRDELKHLRALIRELRGEEQL